MQETQAVSRGQQTVTVSHMSRGDEATVAEPGEFLASRISTQMVQAMKQYYGRGPTSAKSYLVDDLLFVVLRDGITRAEETMLDASRPDSVRRFRQDFEDEMAGRLMSIVEELTERKVVTYQSQVLFDPHMTVEMFVFADEAPA